jgi:polyphenol oxidase
MACRVKRRPEIGAKRGAHHEEALGRGWSLRRAEGVAVLECAPLQELGWVVHGFSVRAGGTSAIPASRGSGISVKQALNRPAPDEGALNLGYTDWDTRENVQENRQRWTKALGAPEFRLVPVRQFHSDAVHLVATSSSSANVPALRGDGMISRETGLLLSVQTADCIPILLADRKKRTIAAVHAGWRGTVQRIAMKAVGRMQMEFGTRPEDIVAAIGPGIGRCCYEVGIDVAREFHSQFANAGSWFDEMFEQLATGEDPNPLPWMTMAPPGHPAPPPRTHLDLHAANRAILFSAGVPEQSIFGCSLCNSCRTDLFFSYRKERVTGRLMAAIGIR